MPKLTTKTKGHRFEKTKFHIPYYTTAFFNPDGEIEENETSTKKDSIIKLPIKIASDGDESRSNITHFEMKAISHFDNNVEAVLEAFSQLHEKVIKPKAIEDKNEEFKLTMKLLQILCNSGPASQTLQEATKIGRTYVYDLHIRDYDDEAKKDILTSDEAAFIQYIEQPFTDIGTCNTTQEFTAFLFQEYKRAIWNHLNSIIFGADYYRAFKQQKNYQMNQLCKPFNVPVEAAFRRIEIMCNLLLYFPPPSSRGQLATAEQWKQFEKIKELPSIIKREMKYNLLPEIFHDRFDELETDWTEMTDTKFLAEAQKCATVDAKERQKLTQSRENLKRKKSQMDKNEHTDSKLDRAQNSKNASAKKRRQDIKTTNAGRARLCELCKLAGAPEYVFNTHYTNHCRKKGDYAKSLSGNVAQRQSKVKEYKAYEKELKEELKLINKVKKLKLTRKKEESIESGEESDDTY